MYIIIAYPFKIPYKTFNRTRVGLTIEIRDGDYFLLQVLHGPQLSLKPIKNLSIYMWIYEIESLSVWDFFISLFPLF